MRVKSFDSTRVFCWRASNLEVYNNMECGILLLPLLLTHLLLVRAADDAVDSTQVKAGNVSTVNECYWSGEGPICDGKCRAGETVVSESKKNDGNGCIIGKKMYCCKDGAVLSSNNGTVALHHVKRQHVIEVTNSSSTQGQLLLGDTKDDCYWVGKSPNCKGSCLEGDYMVNTSRTANGSTCIVGKKKYCCKGSGTNNTLNDVHTHSGSSSTTEAAPVKQMTNGNSSSSCYWVGKAPICLGSCRFGDYVADKSPTGDGGGKCESGQKKFCCARQQSTAPVSTEEPPPPLKTTTSIGQMDNVNNSISNWTSARPFQTRRRPTPRGLPINSTVTNRVKIVKIKRKLVMSTPTVANVSTSISMTSSETSSTLAMAQSLLTLPSTTESTVTTTATSPSTATTESTTPTTITASTTSSTTTTTESTSTTTANTPLTTTPSTTATTPSTTTTPLTTTASTTTVSASTTTESTTTATAATTPSTTAPPTITTTATTTTPSTTIASTTESTTPTTAATTTPSTTTVLATTESTTTPSTTATTTTTIATPTTSTATLTTTTSSTTTTTESTTIETGTTSSTPIRHPTLHPTILATRSTSTATESTSLATGPSTPASTSIKPTSARAPKKFEPFFNLPDVLPVPLIFRIQKSADTDITSLAANIATTSIIQSSTTSTTPTTLE